MKSIHQFLKESTSKNYLLISCGAEKQKGTHKARELYTGPLFELSLQYADKNSDKYDDVYILSGKYGLVELDQKIEYYDIYLPDQSSEYKEKWTKKLIQQFKNKGIDLDNDIITSLCSSHYNDLFRDSIRKLKEPLDGLSMGFRMQWFSERI